MTPDRDIKPENMLAVVLELQAKIHDARDLLEAFVTLLEGDGRERAMAVVREAQVWLAENP